MDELEQQYTITARNAADFTEEHIYKPLVKMLKTRDDENISCEAAVRYCKYVMLPKIDELKAELSAFENKCELNGITEQVLYSTFLINAIEANTLKCMEYLTTTGDAHEIARMEFWIGARHIKNLLCEYRNVNALIRTGTSTYNFNHDTISLVKIGMSYFEVVTLFQMPPTKLTSNTATWSNGKRGEKALKLTIHFEDNMITEIIR